MKWKKLGRIFNPQEVINYPYHREWMKYFSQSTSALVFDDFVRIYFSCRPDKDEDGQAVSYTAFVDVDRKDLTKIINIAKEPVLPLGYLGAFDEFAIYPTCTIRDGTTIRLYYAGWTRCKSVPFNTAIGLAVSHDDGVSFKRMWDGPIMAADEYEPFVISGPKVRKFDNFWFMYYLAGTEWRIYNKKPEIIYKIRMATSKDGIKWNRLHKNIISDVLNETECQAGPDVFYYKHKYHMYFVYREAFDFRESQGRGYKIGYAYSTDLLNWKRDDSQAGIKYSDSGWDSTMQHYPHVFELDDKYYMLYNGNEFGKYGFGLAVMEDE